MTTAKLTAAYDSVLEAINDLAKSGGSHNGREAHLAALHDSLAPYVNDIQLATEHTETEKDAAPDLVAIIRDYLWEEAPVEYLRNEDGERYTVDQGRYSFDIPKTVAALLDATCVALPKVRKLESELGVAKRAATDATEAADNYRTERDNFVDRYNDAFKEAVRLKGELRKARANVADNYIGRDQHQAQLEAKQKHIDRLTDLVSALDGQVSQKAERANYAIRERSKAYEAFNEQRIKAAAFREESSDLKAKLARAEARVDEANNLALRKHKEARSSELEKKRAVEAFNGQLATTSRLRNELGELKAKLARDEGLKAKINADKVKVWFDGSGWQPFRGIAGIDFGTATTKGDDRTEGYL